MLSIVDRLNDIIGAQMTNSVTVMCEEETWYSVEWLDIDSIL